MTPKKRRAGSTERKSLAERDLDAIDAVFRALSHASRRHILIVIDAHGGRINAGRIADRFEHSWPTISRHLRVLEESGLVTTEISGRERHYVIDKGRLFGVGRRWFDFFDAA